MPDLLSFPDVRVYNNKSVKKFLLEGNYYVSG